MDLRLEYASAETAMAELQNRIAFAGGSHVHRDEAVQIAARRSASASILKNTLDQIQSLGVQVKDLDIGLIDFPTLYNGREVLICWKLGEPRIEFWHGLADGFAGRRPIDPEFLAAHQGDLEQ
jgi:hypothetical protein